MQSDTKIKESLRESSQKLTGLPHWNSAGFPSEYQEILIVFKRRKAHYCAGHLLCTKETGTGGIRMYEKQGTPPCGELNSYIWNNCIDEIAVIVLLWRIRWVVNRIVE